MGQFPVDAPIQSAVSQRHRKRLVFTPSDMGTTYDYCFKKIEAEASALRKLAKRALTWVLFAARPLSLGELVHAIIIEESMESKTVPYLYDGHTIIQSYANLITIEGGVIRPVHHTIQYLTLPTACIEGVRSEALKATEFSGITLILS